MVERGCGAGQWDLFGESWAGDVGARSLDSIVVDKVVDGKIRVCPRPSLRISGMCTLRSSIGCSAYLK